MSFNQDGNLARAIAAWGDDCPRWVRLLADAADRLGQGGVAAALGKSGGYVSRVINRRYTGDLAEAERLALAAFGAERVQCPAMSTDISLATCLRSRRRRTTPQNHMHHAFDRVCPHCPNNTDREDD